ncbi:exoribonuclease R [Arthrobacter sp. CAN_A6]|uniref:RNB domain-containing ribonuclease n=1 Tax=Arthrobacter sp. CAN_A6 TaxID=2787721 RepID=UPI001A2918AB
MYYGELVPSKQLDARNRESQDLLAAALHALRQELDLVETFSAAVLTEAEQSISAHVPPQENLTHLDFLTIDPPDSTDLDQAICLERSGSGYRVWYAIADVPGFVEPGGAVDSEARRRGQTIYAPDGRVSLYPESISDAAASLLPGVERPAYVWEFALTPDASVSVVTVRRARIRSRIQLTYQQVEEILDETQPPDLPWLNGSLRLLREVGAKRVQQEVLRGGSSLDLPRQEIFHDGRQYLIQTEPSLPSEDWNAQISLMTGMAAGRMMIDGGIGILRTMPGPDEGALAKFRRQAEVLGTPWPDDLSYGAFLRTLDTASPRQLALMHAAAFLFRGAGYTAFDGEVPDDVEQSAIAAPYAHTTAPLRRLVDRFVLVICEALCAGEAVPQWVRDALPTLNGLMNASNQLASRMESGALEAVQAALLSSRVGEEFEAVVLQGSSRSNGSEPPQRPSGTVQLFDPPVEAQCDGELVVGSTVRVTLVEADIEHRRVRFEVPHTVDSASRHSSPANAGTPGAAG